MRHRGQDIGVPRLTIVISTIGMYSSLERVLGGYERQDAPAGSFEIVVACDRAEPHPGAVDAAIGDRSYHVRRITPERPGLSANRNAGRRAAGAPIVLFTDNDTIPVPGLVSEHLRTHERNPEPEVAVVGHVRWAPELKVTPFMKWLDQGVQFDYPHIEGEVAGWGRLYGANSSMKVELFRRVGDYDEQRLPYGHEDIDWACRADKLGLRVLYNRKAIVDHLRPMTLEFWKKRAQRLAASERTFVGMHPEVEPYFHAMFSDALRHPPARARGLWLAPFVGPGVPWLGPKVWSSVDLSYRQALAPYFLGAWEEAGSSRAEAVVPDLSEREDLSGPK